MNNKNRKLFSIVSLLLIFAASIYSLHYLYSISGSGNLVIAALIVGTFLGCLIVYLERAYYLGENNNLDSRLPLVFIAILIMIQPAVKGEIKGFVNIVISVCLTVVGIFFFRKQMKNHPG